MSGIAAPDDEAGPVATTEERWIYGGIRVLNGRRIHAWIDPHGHEGLYQLKRAGNWAIGCYYTAQVVRTGEATRLYGAPTYAGGGHAPDEVRRQLWAKDTAARTRLALLAQERNQARRNAIDEALEPLITMARAVRTSADRDALTAYVMRRLISSWYPPHDGGG
ncbi:hypothetical protein WEI85_00665 [Actinomycetes bacterium KLBMP 9797]